MNNYEWLKTLSVKEVAKMFVNCNDYCIGEDCDNCSQVKENIEWLLSEHKE